MYLNHISSKPPESAVKKVFLNPFNIQLIEPKDHFFDSEDRAERKHAKRKNATTTDGRTTDAQW
jgi:hypothetical protein